MMNTDSPIKKELTTRPNVKVGISIGDVNGIGPEVIMKAISDTRLLVDCTIIIYASSKVFSFHQKALKGEDDKGEEFNYNNCNSIEDIELNKINVVKIWDDEIPFDIGKATADGGKHAFESLEKATQDLASGKIDVLVTAPINKDAMNKSGFKFPGHTEYLADLAGEEEALMLMISSTLRVGLVTSHIPLKEVSETVTIDKVVAKLSAFNDSLMKDFGIKRPKIAVLGLNPHAGENGKMGSEENESISPAITRASNQGMLVFGPFPADGFFGSDSRYKYDGVLAMYHDQGLAAFKALSFDEGVNFTAGLPIVRTSPDHGTAYDIVGQNKASGDSMRNAIYLAIDVHRNHLMEKELNENPLAISEKKTWKRDR